MKRVQKNRSKFLTKFLAWFVATWFTIGIIAISISQCSVSDTSDRTNQKRDHVKTQQIELMHKKCAQVPLPKKERLTAKQTLRVHDLIKTHPIEEIRTMFFTKILNGNVCLGQRIYGEDDALFKPIPAISNYVPFLFVRDSILSTRREWLAQLVIYHEYVHYKHWLEGRLGNDTMEQEKIEVVSHEERMDHCKKIWYTEFEAYQKECVLAWELGTAARLAFCSIDQNSHTFPLIEKHIVDTHRWSETCANVWHGLVGSD